MKTLGTKAKHRGALWVLVTFFIVSCIGGVFVVRFAGDRGDPAVSPLYGNLKGYFQSQTSDRSQSAPALAAFSSLHEEFKMGGMAQFEEKKLELRSEVASLLKSRDDSKEKDRAENIALYLFPDLLQRDDFERDVAMDQWLPLEKSIEKNPKSERSRQEFEELKNNVWNYENPDRQSPVVSDYAEQIIRIYDVLSQVE